jgi:hypothetical protein
VRVPDEGEADWVVSSLSGSSGERILVGHRWSHRFDAAVMVQVTTGEASIHALIDGTIREVSVEEAHSVIPGPIADVIFHVLESINAGSVAISPPTWPQRQSGPVPNPRQR